MRGFRLPAVFHGILTRLLLLGLALVIVGAVVRYFVISDFVRDGLGTVVAEQQVALARYVARDIDYKVSERRLLLESLAQALPTPLLDSPEALRAWLRERYDYRPLFSLGLGVLDLQGGLLADYPSGGLALAGVEHAGRDYFLAAQRGDFLIGRAVSEGSGEAAIPMAVPVRDVAGRIVAVLVGATALAAPGFLDSLRHGQVGDSGGGFLLVAPRDRLLLAASRPETRVQPMAPNGVNPLHDQAVARQIGSSITVDARGDQELSAMVAVPSADWIVVAHVPAAEAFAPLGHLQRFVVRNALLAVLVFALFFSAALYWSFRPLFRAARQADRMTLGEIPLEPLAVVRDDEVGHLVAAFNRLLRKLQDNQAELARLAHHDALTGLPNRLLLADRLQLALALARRKSSRLALLFLDLDGFKPINDALGHEGGDEALRQVAERFSAIVRQGDTLARVGGDEFVLLIGDLDAAGAAAAAGTVALKFIDALREPLVIAGQACALGVSIGVALGDGRGNPHELLLAADRAMYRAKEEGRGHYVIDGGEPQ